MRLDTASHDDSSRRLKDLTADRTDQSEPTDLQTQRVSVVIPVRNEAKTIGSLVRLVKDRPHVCEVLVVDDGSVDGSREVAARAGASVMMSSYLGRGASMEDGSKAAKGDIVLFLDGGMSDVPEDIVELMVQPILGERADLVKARFTPSVGRVTALTARPLLKAFFPELVEIAQPLGGTLAARRSILTGLRFENDHGVDVGLLIDAAMKGATIVEAHIGGSGRTAQPLEALDDMAGQITRVILDRAWRHDRLSINQIRETFEAQRRDRHELLPETDAAPGAQRYALLDMDEVLVDGRYAVELAEQVGAGAELARFIDNQAIPDDERARLTGSLFTGVSYDIFEQIARDMPLVEGAVETVLALRKAGYQVGVLTHNFQVAAEVIRRRVFADFAMAHLLRFRNGACTGEVVLAPAMLDPEGCPQHPCCKSNVLRHLRAAAGLTPQHVLAVGAGLDDICLLRAAGVSVAFRPKSKLVAKAAGYTVERSLRDVVELVSPPRHPVATGIA